MFSSENTGWALGRTTVSKTTSEALPWLLDILPLIALRTIRRRTALSVALGMFVPGIRAP